ncbi:hypothetical protein EVAR_91310_1 [Eumeta japonica]|uniref:Reverse transcriptase domain-containing protein n=1 Tax=Eumeta variegata TaxID=151549 RepID=A0A4C1SRI0_EUMVA|nr:hypothetical protein EVAR_91310_1 [Eumeta japonica]
MSSYTHNLNKKLLNLAIKQNHQLLGQFRHDLEMIIYSLEGLFTLKELDEFLSYDDILAESFNKKVKAVHRKKFADLYELQKRELGIKLNNKWFINKSDVNIPQDIQWVLSLGPKHGLPIESKEFPVLKIIADSEDFLQTLENKEEQEIARSRLAMIIDNHIKIGRNSDRDRFVLDKVRKARHFLKENRDVVILNSDKGNLTVAMNRCDYELRMEDIVGDTAGYLLINKDPTSRKGLPMGSPASPVVADIVMEELLDCCIEKLAIRPKIITKYVDDLFCVVSEVYRIPCGGNGAEECGEVYIGTTKNKLRTRLAGHKSDQKYRTTNLSHKTALTAHCVRLNHFPKFEDTTVLNRKAIIDVD